MKIGIIGSGAIGGILGKLWAQAGHDIVFSSRRPETLTSLVAQAGDRTRAGTVAQAAEFGDVILLAVNYGTLDEALSEINGKLNRKIVIDATNPVTIAIAMAGDDRAAKETVTQLIEDAGYLAVDIGSLDESAPLDPSGVLWNSAITAAELHQRLNVG